MGETVRRAGGDDIVEGRCVELQVADTIRRVTRDRARLLYNLGNRESINTPLGFLQFLACTRQTLGFVSSMSLTLPRICIMSATAPEAFPDS